MKALAVSSIRQTKVALHFVECEHALFAQHSAAIDHGLAVILAFGLKPFELDELLARIRALLRRASGRAEPVYEHKGVSINPSTREASVNGVPVVLSGREWAVLDRLIARKRAIVSKVQIEEALYAFGAEVESNTVEVYVSRLRRKLGKEAIETVRGVGYRISADAN